MDRHIFKLSVQERQSRLFDRLYLFHTLSDSRNFLSYVLFNLFLLKPQSLVTLVLNLDLS